MLKRLLIPVSLLAMATACGGLNGKQSNELTQEERSEVCEDLADYAAGKISDDDNKKFACVIAGETTAALDMSTTCEDARDACLAAPSMPGEDGDCSTAEATDCTATVGEMKDCFEAQIDESAAYIKSFDCGATDGAAPTALPSECDVVKEKCPDMFE